MVAITRVDRDELLRGNGNDAVTMDGRAPRIKVRGDDAALNDVVFEEIDQLHAARFAIARSIARNRQENQVLFRKHLECFLVPNGFAVDVISRAGRVTKDDLFQQHRRRCIIDVKEGDRRFSGDQPDRDKASPSGSM